MKLSSLCKENIILPQPNWYCPVVTAGTWLGFHVVFFHCHTNKIKKKNRETEMTPLFTFLTYEMWTCSEIHSIWDRCKDNNLPVVFPFHHGRPNNLFFRWQNFNPRGFTEVWGKKKQTRGNDKFTPEEMKDTKMEIAAPVWLRTISLHQNVDGDTFRVHLPRIRTRDRGHFHITVSLNITWSHREEH